MKSAALLVFILASHALTAAKACEVLASNGRPAPRQGDALFRVLATAEACPQDVLQLRALLAAKGLSSKPSLVANRGRNNPKLGSFSLFERVLGRLADGQVVGDGQFFFGHFTAAHQGRLVLDQAPAAGKLLIELIAWDPAKKLYNFYELIGRPSGATWFYRGDSADILADNLFVHRDPPPGQPRFGARLRCSACHSSGGPIMKELAAPHNDWWTGARALTLAQTPEPALATLLRELDGAESFARSVAVGIESLERSPVYQGLKARTDLQVRLRPLFCENELNLMSDASPNEQRKPVVALSSSVFAHPRLAGASTIAWPRANYEQSLRALGLRFPENGASDADHAALVPVRSYSDERAIASLLQAGVIDTEFVADVLAVDGANPLFSRGRCSLLKFLPTAPARTDWRQSFLRGLQASSSPFAQELVANLTDPARTAEAHAQGARARLATVAAELRSPEGSTRILQGLVRLRQAAFESEISRNPRGQILEPGFRVIWPVPTRN